MVVHLTSIFLKFKIDEITRFNIQLDNYKFSQREKKIIINECRRQIGHIRFEN